MRRKCTYQSIAGSKHWSCLFLLGSTIMTWVLMGSESSSSAREFVLRIRSDATWRSVCIQKAFECINCFYELPMTVFKNYCNTTFSFKRNKQNHFWSMRIFQVLWFAMNHSSKIKLVKKGTLYTIHGRCISYAFRYKTTNNKRTFAFLQKVL